MIKITRLNKYFYRNKQNEIHVINDTSLEFPETGLIAILGESGSGKTTLMNVIGGLDSFSSGTIKIDEFEISKYHSRLVDRIRNEKVGYIFQNYLLLQNRTVYYNLELSLNMYNLTDEEKEKRINYVLNAVGMLKYKKRNVKELSGGQQQRVSIARALIKAPSLILADEPTGNLDEKNTIQIMNIIKKVSKTTLVVLVSHEKNIATSYADALIQISDGKIVSNTKNSNTTLYSYKEDQNLYLKDYNRTEMDSSLAKINLYTNDECHLELNIIFENGKYYISSATPLNYITGENEVKIIDDHKKKINVSDEATLNDFHLESVPYKGTPRLSLKEVFILARTNLKHLKKKGIFLSLSLFVMSILMMLCIQSITSASKIDKKSITVSDSHLCNVNFENAELIVAYDSKRNILSQFYDNFKKDNPDISVALKTSSPLYYNLEGYSQLQGARYEIKGFSYIDLDHLDSKNIIYGTYPKLANEIVIDEWVIRKTIDGTVLGNFMSNPKAFIGEALYLSNSNIPLKIVGISNLGENAIYLNKWMNLSLFSSDLKRYNTPICSLSELKKYDSSFADLSLNEDEVFVNSLSNNFKESISLLNKMYNVSKILDFKHCPFYAVVNDETYDSFLKNICIYNGNYELTFYANNQNEKDQIKSYTSSYKTPFVIDNKEVKIKTTFISAYDDTLAPVYEEANKTISSRIIVIFTIFIISFIILYFTMKSYTTGNIYDIGVYRALGISKGSVVLVYAIEIFVISLRTSLIGTLISFIVTNIVTAIPILDINISISFTEFALVTASLFAVNILIGILPVSTQLRLTPSQLMSKYDL